MEVKKNYLCRRTLTQNIMEFKFKKGDTAYLVGEAEIKNLTIENRIINSDGVILYSVAENETLFKEKDLSTLAELKVKLGKGE